jgi:cytochrome d ubiquinol oxidase subunit II
MAAAACIYGVTGGADFGAGIWEALSGRQLGKGGRNFIYGSMGPVWEANHVWLVLVLVFMFSAFPTAFAGMARALWLPLLLALLALVIRGSAYGFRYASPESGTAQTIWRIAFAAGSVAGALLLGAGLGIVLTGITGLDARGNFTGDYIRGWMVPLAGWFGVLSVSACAFLSAAYFSRETHTDFWRRRTLNAGYLTLAMAVATPWICRGIPPLYSGLTGHSLAWLAGSLVLGTISLSFSFARRSGPAAWSGAGFIFLFLGALLYSIYPAIIPPFLTVASTKGPTGLLKAMVTVLAVGAIPLIVALVMLFRLFKSPRKNS